jgi:hypothetical protein
VGALQIFTDESPSGLIAGQSYTVLRALREVSRRSRIGVIGVQRLNTDSTDSYNRTFAVDGRIGIGDAWTMDFWAAGTQTPGRTGNELGYSARAAYSTRDWNNSIRIIQLGEDFNPEVGFLNRVGGYDFYDINFMRFFRKQEWSSWFRQWNPHVNYRGYVGRDGFYQSGQFHVDFTEIEFSSGARFGPELNVFHEGLQDDFAIADSVILRPGGYDWWQLGLDWQTNPSANLSMIMRGDFGPFYTGTRSGGNVTITARLHLLVLAPAGLPGREARRGRLHALARRSQGGVFLHATHLHPDAHAVQQPAAHLDGQRALRLAQHGGDRALRRLQ